MAASPPIVFEVQELPPIRDGSSSMFKPPCPRVSALLRAAREAIARDGFQPFREGERLGIEVILCGQPSGDGMNYLGGIADALQDKTRQLKQCPGAREHLGDLADIIVYPDDKWIHEFRYRQEPGDKVCYTVRVWSLG